MSLRLAWFSPLPPSTSGIAAYSTELVPLLAARGLTIEPFDEANAHDFVWKQRRNPYDLTVFNMGNAACHDYMWAYLFRYPGMVVLHDAQLHQARALALTKRWIPRREDYLDEFRANHPLAPPHIGELIAAGLGQGLFHHWPHIRLVLETSRLTVVHNRRLLADLRHQYPTVSLECVEMGVSDPLAHRTTDVPPSLKTAYDARAMLSLPDNAVVLAAFGGVTPEKRIGPILRALQRIVSRHPHVHLLLVGRETDHYDVMADAEHCGVASKVHLTGYVADEELPAYLLAADVCACLRWPTNRETSASWLRCLAAGRTTLVTGLADLVDVPTVDPRGWRPLDVKSPARESIAVSIDLVDEDRCLEMALDRLVVDESLRTRLGTAGRAWWSSHHQLSQMADVYSAAIRKAIEQPVRHVTLPRHLTADTSEHLASLTRDFGVSDRLDLNRYR